MIGFRWQSFRFVLPALLLLSLTTVTYGDDWMDVEEPFEYGIQPPSYGEMPPPPQPQPEESKPWYKKVFNPITKHFRPPIYQPKKYPKETPRETVALPDPLIRLGSGIEVNGTVVSPGFYLLRLTGGDQAPALAIVQQQQVLASIPATTASPPSDPASQPTTPPEEKTEPADQEDWDRKAPEATASVRYAENGEALYLIYQKEGTEYISAPVPIVTTSWGPAY